MEITSQKLSLSEFFKALSSYPLFFLYKKQDVVPEASFDILFEAWRRYPYIKVADHVGEWESEKSGQKV